MVGYGYRLATDSDLLAIRYQLDTAAGVDTDPPPAEPIASIYPNPSRGDLWIDFGARAIDAHGATIFDAAGRMIRSIDAGAGGGGTPAARWDGCDAAGTRMQPGVYFARITGGGRTESLKLVLIR